MDGRQLENFELVLAYAPYAGLLFLIYVGLSPFDARDAAAMASRAGAAAGGDLLRQLSFLGAFAFATFACVWFRGAALFRGLSASLGILILWCLLSSLWAADPDIVLRRAILAAMFVASVFLNVETIGFARAMMLWRMMLVAVMAGDWLSVALVHQAIHLPTDVEADLAGAWRGLQPHKNAAGFFAAICTIVFAMSALRTRRWSYAALAFASAAFLVMTRSKTSLGLVPVVLTAALIYRATLRDKLDFAIAAVAALILLFFLGLALFLNWSGVLAIFDDPRNFTGRTAIWQAELAYVADHPWLGAGYGAFSNTGAASPIYYYVGSSWVSKIGEGHSGYLEILVSLGAIGLALAVAALLVVPFVRFWRATRLDVDERTLLFALCTFLVLHNFLESDLLEGTSIQWGQYLLLMAFQRNALAPDRVSRRQTGPLPGGPPRPLERQAASPPLEGSPAAYPAGRRLDRGGI